MRDMWAKRILFYMYTRLDVLFSLNFQEHGMKPIIGDLVVASKSAASCSLDTGEL